jgi:3-methylcrotonyl-CoA carboxylase beta subunit
MLRRRLGACRRRRHRHRPHSRPRVRHSSPTTPPSKAAPIIPSLSRSTCELRRSLKQNRFPCVYLVDSGGAFLPRQAEVFPDRDHISGASSSTRPTCRSAAFRRVAARHGLVHRRRRLRSGDGRRVGDRQGQRHHFPRRPRLSSRPPPARSSRPRSSAAPTSTAARRASPTTFANNDAHALAITRNIVKQSRAAFRPRARRAAGARGAAVRRRRALRRDDPRDATRSRTTCATVICAPRRRQPLPRVQGALRRRRSSPASRTIAWLCRSASSPTTASCFPSRPSRARTSSSCATQRGIPLLFLQNITGFMVGKTVRGGRHRASDGAKLVMAVACAKVPKFTVLIGGSFRCRQLRHVRTRVCDPRMLFMWPNSRISRDGRRAGGRRALAGAAVRIWRAAASTWTDEQPSRKFEAPILRQVRGGRDIRSIRRRGSGTTASSIRRRLASRALARALRLAQLGRVGPDAGLVRCVPHVSE